MFSASAIAANTIMRSLFGAIFPLFAVMYYLYASYGRPLTLLIQSYMFEAMGIQYGMTLLGCVAALFIPMPFVLYKYGKSIRARSKFAPAPDIEQDKRRDEESRGVSEGDESMGNGSSETETKEVDEKKSD